MMLLDQSQGIMAASRSALSVFLSPLHLMVDYPINTFEAASNQLVSRFALTNENSSLKKENLILKGRLQKLKALEAENQRLHELLASTLPLGEQMLIAKILAVDTDPFSHTILINKGHQAGVKVGQTVLDAHGIMGQLIDVNPLTSRAILISDASHALPVQLLRNGLRLIAEGTGVQKQLSIRHMPNTADIQEGDILVTSGLGQRFPQGYPVARVTQVIHDPGRPFMKIIATPTAMLDRARHVLIVQPGTKKAVASEKQNDL